jgi:hypothetical protein
MDTVSWAIRRSTLPKRVIYSDFRYTCNDSDCEVGDRRRQPMPKTSAAFITAIAESIRGTRA